MDFVPDIIGERAYQQMNEMAKRGDFSSPPDQTADDSGFNRREYKAESYNIFRGVYNGGIKTFKVLKFDPPVPAKVDLVAMLHDAAVKDAAGAVNYFEHRFLRVRLQEQDRVALVKFLKDRIGEGAMDEVSLRELLHLILSTPEYQLA